MSFTHHTISFLNLFLSHSLTGIRILRNGPKKRLIIKTSIHAIGDSPPHLCRIISLIQYHGHDGSYQQTIHAIAGVLDIQDAVDPYREVVRVIYQISPTTISPIIGYGRWNLCRGQTIDTRQTGQPPRFDATSSTSGGLSVIVCSRKRGIQCINDDCRGCRDQPILQGIVRA